MIVSDHNFGMIYIERSTRRFTKVIELFNFEGEDGRLKMYKY